ncbi:MarR family winged helix-turn-helix transcriptional regulator [Lactococcus ileimucosae]|uniref:MarR family winged helix-turn-helix transcriptional regulator n=1 Tax=Lactococcus ileimucosae TaxID=2941329 RepID=A0ABV4D0Q5_9LACT
MSAETNKLLSLFSKLLHNPQLIMALHRERMSNQLGERKPRMGAQGLLVELWKTDGLTNAEIAELLDIRPSSVTAQVKSLEQRGLVKRVTDENDKRVSRVFLTKEGKQAQVDYKESQDDLSEGIFGHLTKEEQLSLIHILEKLEESIKGEEEFDFHLANIRPGSFDPRMIHHMGREMEEKMRKEMCHQMREAHKPWNFPYQPRNKRAENWNDF